MATAVTQPLLETIEPDDPTPTRAPANGNNLANAGQPNTRAPVTLTPSNRPVNAMGSQDLESGKFYYMHLMYRLYSQLLTIRERYHGYIQTGHKLLTSPK